MRLWVVLTGLALAFSGCIGGHVTSKPRDDNATADPDAFDGPGDDLDEAPPWAIKDDGSTDGQKDGVTSGGKGTSKDPGAGDPGTGSDSGDATSDDGEGASTDQGGSTEPEPDPVEGVLDDAATEGASGLDDVAGGAGETVDGTLQDATSDGSKDPVGGLVGSIAGLLG